MRWIYLSPHFDDAVLSCGGLIRAQSQEGLAVEIWTIFAGDPPPGPLSEFALKIHARQNQEPELPRYRRAHWNPLRRLQGRK